MTDNNPLKDFSDIITSYQDSSLTAGKFPEGNKDIMPPRKCLQCRVSLSSSNLGPYCSSQCMQAHDSGQIHKPDNNIMKEFSKVFE